MSPLIKTGAKQWRVGIYNVFVSRFGFNDVLSFGVKDQHVRYTWLKRTAYHQGIPRMIMNNDSLIYDVLNLILLVESSYNHSYCSHLGQHFCKFKTVVTKYSSSILQDYLYIYRYHTFIDTDRHFPDSHTILDQWWIIALLDITTLVNIKWGYFWNDCVLAWNTSERD